MSLRAQTDGVSRALPLGIERAFEAIVEKRYRRPLIDTRAGSR